MNKLITFNTLKVVGFAGLIDFKVFKLNDPGLTIIRGKNGAGKTSIISALLWVLFGKTAKAKSDVETWEHLRGPDYPGTMVSISFYKGSTKYKITRCKNYKRVIGSVKGGNRLIVEQEGTVITLKDKRDIQAYINEVLGFSYEVFVTAIVYNQIGTPFLEIAGPQKKAILEESFQINWLTKALQVAKTRKQELLPEKRVLEVKQESVISKIVSIEDMLNSVEESRKEFEEEKQKEIQELEGNLAELKKLVAKTVSTKDLDTELLELENKRNIAKQSLEEFKQANPNLESQYREQGVKVSSEKRQLEKLKTKLLTYTEQKDKVCQECGQPLTNKKHTELKRALQTQITSLTLSTEASIKQQKDLRGKLAQLETLKDKVEVYNVAIREKQKALQKIYEENLASEKAKASISEVESQLARVKSRKFKDPSKNLKESLAKLRLQEKAISLQLKRVIRNIKLLDWAISDPLSNSGIKVFLFDKLLAKLNARLGYYSKFTGIRVTLEVDMDSARKDINAIIYKDGAPVSYPSLSGGEMQIANGLVAMASGDVLLEEHPVNFRFYDEITRGLDPDNVRVMSELLRAIAVDHSVYIITHSPEFIVEGATEILIGEDYGKN